MKENYKITIQYEGTRYDGWQKQGNTDNTIQGKLEQILEKMTGELVEIHGSGRTDAGVHAMGQVANFHLPEGQEAPAVMQYLNRYLPDDIAVTAIERVPERFHSRLNAVKKTYLYQIETGPKRDVFVRRMQYGLGQPLDVEAMRLAAKLLVGTQDYKSFCGNRKMKKSSVRTVESITVHCDPGSSVIAISFVGNGFLQNMVRIMTGTLIEVGLKKRSWKEMPAILAAKDRQEAGFTAPAEGLCLAGVIYGDE
ncbi:MAG: tRNA pseudouridine(38-40) synthase TruA [Lachnospiraceae bacterium]|nr:tRNA pseudouridine(38-40) synthase TruA [Lachnospiraceae bacterium]